MRQSRPKCKIFGQELHHLIVIDKKDALQSNGNFFKLRQIMENDAIHSIIVDRFPVRKLVSPDEKFQKAIGQTTLKKLVLIFCGSRMVYHGEAAAAGNRSLRGHSGQTSGKQR